MEPMFDCSSWSVADPRGLSTLFYVGAMKAGLCVSREGCARCRTPLVELPILQQTAARSKKGGSNATFLWNRSNIQRSDRKSSIFLKKNIWSQKNYRPAWQRSVWQLQRRQQLGGSSTTRHHHPAGQTGDPRYLYFSFVSNLCEISFIICNTPLRSQNQLATWRVFNP